MSYLGRKPIKIPNKVKLELQNNVLFVEGPLGSTKRAIHKEIKLDIKNDTLIVNKPKEKQYLSMGTLQKTYQ